MNSTEPTYPDQDLSRSSLQYRVRILGQRIAAQHNPAALGAASGGLFSPATENDLEELRAEHARLSSLQDHWSTEVLPAWTEWLDWAKGELTDLRARVKHLEAAMLQAWKDEASMLPLIREWTTTWRQFLELQDRMKPIAVDLGWQLRRDRLRYPWGQFADRRELNDPRKLEGPFTDWLAAYRGWSLPAPQGNVRRRRPGTLTTYAPQPGLERVGNP